MSLAIAILAQDMLAGPWLLTPAQCQATAGMQAGGCHAATVEWPQEHAVLIAKLKKCVNCIPEGPAGAPLPLDVLPLLLVAKASCEQLASELHELCYYAIAVAGGQESTAAENNHADADSTGQSRGGTQRERRRVHIALPGAMPAHASYCLAVAQLLLAAATAVELTDAMHSWLEGLHAPVHEWLLGFQPLQGHAAGVSQGEQAAARASSPAPVMPAQGSLLPQHAINGWTPVRYDFLKKMLVCGHGVPPLLLNASAAAEAVVFTRAGTDDTEEAYLKLEGDAALLVQASQATEFVVREGSLRMTGPTGVTWLTANQAGVISLAGPPASRLQVTAVAVGNGHCALYAALLSKGELPQPPLSVLSALASCCRGDPGL